MILHELGRIGQSVVRRLRNPRENPMSMREMAWFYLLRKIHLWRHRLPAIEVPFAWTGEEVSWTPRIAVVVHCYYLDLIDEILSGVRQIPFPYRLYISTDAEEKRAEILRRIEAQRIDGAEVRLAPNRGRDIAPKLVTFGDVYAGCDYFLHLHSKKSPHTGSWGEQWRGHLLGTLVGSPEIVRANLRVLGDARVGLVFAESLNDTLPGLRWGANFAAASELARRLGVEIDRNYCPDYPDGSMFWGKAAVLRPLLDLGLRLEDFEEETGQLDGCLHHAVERLVVHGAREQGLYGCRVSTSAAYPNLRRVRDAGTLEAAVSACVAAQEEERARYAGTGRRSATG